MFEDYSSLLLRLGLGAVFIYFGLYEKLLHPELTRPIIENLNLSIPISIDLFVLLFGLIEIVVGSFLILGLFTRITAIVAALMIGTIILQLGFLAVPRDIALFAIALSLLVTGSKVLSLDRYISKKKYL